MASELPALGICLEEYEYPYPVRFFPVSNDLQLLRMAYMDIPPGTEPNGKTVVLIHGKAFGCYYISRFPTSSSASSCPSSPADPIDRPRRYTCPVLRKSVRLRIITGRTATSAGSRTA
jgi:hypothetical protein